MNLETKERVQQLEQGLAVRESVGSTDITTAQDAEYLGDLRGELVGAIKEIEKERKDITSGLNSTLKKVNAFFKRIRTPYEDAKADIDDKLLAWHESQKALSAKAFEDLGSAEEPEDLKALLIASVAESGVKTRKTWDYEITDFSKVLDCFKTIDTVALRKFLMDNREQARTPGVRFFQKESVR